MRLWLAIGVAPFFLPVPGHAADGVPGSEAQALLQKAALAAYQHSYSGTYVRQHGSDVDTFRVTYLRDDSGEHEKLEVLDDSPREMIRHNDEALCFKPEQDAVVAEKRKVRKSFPALLPKQLGGLLENYRVRLGERGRVGGRACQVLLLEPKDHLRYRHKLCVDQESALLLKMATLDERGGMVDQLAFTQLTIDGKISKEHFKPTLSGKKLVMQQDKSVVTDVEQYDSSWNIGQLPPGFSKIMAVRRTLPGKTAPVSQLVFSDGLATVSVFIEPRAGAKGHPGASGRGATNIFIGTVGDYQITVLGEVPAATVSQMGRSVSYSGKPDKAP